MLRSAVALLLLTTLSLAAQNAPVYKDPNAPLDKRLDDLLSRMTLEEKVSQMMNDSPAIDRLGVPAYNWWNECLHGVARAGIATVFPQAIGMAATWDTDLFARMAAAISDEARAKHHEFVRQGKRGIYQGLTFWTPNINLFRDPRWGRGMETYGEDPYLTGRLATEFIRGLQGKDSKYLKTIATAKHYAVHSGPESLRHTFDAVVNESDLRDTYLPQFEMAVKDGGARSVMCAYNRVNGLPACASTPLENDILRKQWSFSGYIVSDCGAVGDIYENHKTQPTAEAGVAAAVKAGTDLNCGVEYMHLVPAVKQGLISEAEINTSVRRLLTARFQLGMFDPPEMVPYAQIPYSVNDSAEHKELAVEVARKSIVLLKNEGSVLPLRKNLKTLAVIGPNADSVEVLVGNYNGDPSDPITPLEGIRRKLGSGTNVLFAAGSDIAAGLPMWENIPQSALLTTNGADKKPGLVGEYFKTANFNGKAYRMRELTYPNSGKMAGTVPPKIKPVFTRVDQQVAFNWRSKAPRAGMDDDNFGVRWTGFVAPKDQREVLDRGSRNERVRAVRQQQACRAGQQHPRALVRVRASGTRSRQTIPGSPGLSRDHQRCRDPADLVPAAAAARRGGGQDRAPGRRCGVGARSIAAPGRRRDEGRGPRILGRRPDSTRAAAGAERPHRADLASREAGRTGPDERQCGGCELGARSRARHRRAVVSRRGRRNGAGGRAVRRLQPGRAAADHVL